MMSMRLVNMRNLQMRRSNTLLPEDGSWAAPDILPITVQEVLKNTSKKGPIKKCDQLGVSTIADPF